MRELVISNINSADAKQLADDYELYLSNVGCTIYIWAVGHRMTIEWQTTTPYTISHLLIFVDDKFGDIVDFPKLNRAIKNLEDDHAIIIDFNSGEFEVKTL